MRSETCEFSPPLPLQEQGVRFCGDHRAPPQLLPQLPRQRPAGVVSGPSHRHANEAVVEQEVGPQQGLPAQREALVGGDQAAKTGRQGGAGGPQGSGLDHVERRHPGPRRRSCRCRGNQRSVLSAQVGGHLRVCPEKHKHGSSLRRYRLVSSRILD